ncbi:MAG: hypothetical protein MK110_08735 [Fuerstiella sp.]|nr:hypothetical protein [Fuerstiella sp.]
MTLIPGIVRNRILYDELFLTKPPAANKWAVTFRDGSGGNLAWPEPDSARKMEQLLDVPPGVLNDRHAYKVHGQLMASGLSFDETENLMSRVSIDAIRTDPETFFRKAFKQMVYFWRCVAGSPPFGGGSDKDYLGQKLGAFPFSLTLDHFSPVICPVIHSGGINLFSFIALLAAVRLLTGGKRRWMGIVVTATFCYFCLRTG